MQRCKVGNDAKDVAFNFIKTHAHLPLKIIKKRALDMKRNFFLYFCVFLLQSHLVYKVEVDVKCKYNVKKHGTQKKLRKK